MPTLKDTNVTPVETGVQEPVKDTGEALKLSIDSPEPKQDAEYAEFLKYKEEQKAIKTQQELLAPIGGMEGFNKAKEIIANSGNEALREKINAKLSSNDPKQQASGIIEMAAYMDVVNNFKATQEDTPMSSPLPKIGQSSAPTMTNPEQDSSLPEVKVGDGIHVANIKHPRVKKAVEQMYDKFDELSNLHGDLGNSLHNIAAKAAYETLGKLVKSSESAFGDPKIAQEALYVWGRINDQITEKANQIGDPTYARTKENAEKVAYQFNEMEKLRTNGNNNKVTYLEQMFPGKK